MVRRILLSEKRRIRRFEQNRLHGKYDEGGYRSVSYTLSSSDDTLLTKSYSNPTSFSESKLIWRRRRERRLRERCSIGRLRRFLFYLLVTFSDYAILESFPIE